MTTNVLEHLRRRARFNFWLQTYYFIEKYRMKKDLKKVAKRESLFATLAKKEGKGAAERAKEEAKDGMTESAKDSRREATWDKEFAMKRRKIARRAKMKERE